MQAVATEPLDTDVRPQTGAQERFLRSSAYITVYGGARGGGKSYALIMEPLYHKENPRFGAVIFRRESTQVTQEGGLWDIATDLYSDLGAKSRKSSSRMDWTFPSGAKVKFANMKDDDDYKKWEGASIPLLGFDQVEHFTKKQFFRMLACVRSTCGVTPYVRCTCNPDPDHWLRKFMDWWIDRETGYPIPERAGVVRWFTTVNEQHIWADHPRELIDEYGEEFEPKSFTFIPATIEDNQALLRANPGYIASFNLMSTAERERLRFGNWNVREQAGDIFNRDYFEIIPVAPSMYDSIRYWDRASTKPKPGQKDIKRSWTAGVRMGATESGLFIITHVAHFQDDPGGVETKIKNVASQDGRGVRIGIEGDPGSAGVFEVDYYIKALAGYDVAPNKVRESKGARARPFAAQVRAGNVKIVGGDWDVEAYLSELHNFDGSTKCLADRVDASSGAFFMLTDGVDECTW